MSYNIVRRREYHRGIVRASDIRVRNSYERKYMYRRVRFFERHDVLRVRRGEKIKTKTKTPPRRRDISRQYWSITIPLGTRSQNDWNDTTIMGRGRRARGGESTIPPRHNDFFSTTTTTPDTIIIITIMDIVRSRAVASYYYTCLYYMYICICSVCRVK